MTFYDDKYIKSSLFSTQLLLAKGFAAWKGYRMKDQE